MAIPAVTNGYHTETEQVPNMIDDYRLYLFIWRIQLVVANLPIFSSGHEQVNMAVNKAGQYRTLGIIDKIACRQNGFSPLSDALNSPTINGYQRIAYRLPPTPVNQPAGTDICR